MRTKTASTTPLEKACDSARLPGQRVLLADQHFCSVDFELVFSGYGSPTEVLNLCPIWSILGNPLINELKMTKVVFCRFGHVAMA